MMIQSAIPTSLSLNIGGRLLSLDHPRVMGILNATPDSFYAGSRCGNDETIIANRARAIIEEGGDMIDVGAYSSRPDATDIPLEEEWQRLDRALSVIRGLYPDAILSVDTFRAEIARRSVERHGVQIINDISEGGADIISTSPGWTGHVAFVDPIPEFVGSGDIEEWLSQPAKIVTLHPMTIMQNSLNGTFGQSGDISNVPPRAATIKTPANMATSTLANLVCFMSYLLSCIESSLNYRSGSPAVAPGMRRVRIGTVSGSAT